MISCSSSRLPSLGTDLLEPWRCMRPVPPLPGRLAGRLCGPVAGLLSGNERLPLRPGASDLSAPPNGAISVASDERRVSYCCRAYATGKSIEIPSAVPRVSVMYCASPRLELGLWSSALPLARSPSDLGETFPDCMPPVAAGTPVRMGVRAGAFASDV